MAERGQAPETDVDLLTSDTALLETLILQAPVAFAFYGPDLRYRRINRMLADINGLPMADHIGRRPAELLGDLGVAVEERLQQVLRTGEVVSDDDFNALSPVTGELRHYQSQWFPARDADGTVFGIAVLVSDVTDRRRAEDALRRSVERTEQLQQATAALGEALTVADVRRVVARTAPMATGARTAEVLMGADWQHLLAAAPAGGTRVEVPLVVSGGRHRRPGARLRRPPAGGRGPVRGCARRPVRHRAGAGPALRAGAVDCGDPAAQPAAGPAAGGARARAGRPVPGRLDRRRRGRRLVRRVLPPGRPPGAGGRRRDGQGRPGRSRHGPPALRTAGPGARQPLAGGRAVRPGPRVHRHRGRRPDRHPRLPPGQPGRPPGRRRGSGAPAAGAAPGRPARPSWWTPAPAPPRSAGRSPGPSAPWSSVRATCCSG